MNETKFPPNVDVCGTLLRVAKCQYDGTMSGRYKEEDVRNVIAIVSELIEADLEFDKASSDFYDIDLPHSDELCARYANAVKRRAAALAKARGEA